MRNIPEEIKKLTEDYDYLITTGRQQIRSNIKAAMKNGKDLPDNLEYLEAKEEQARLEERIIELRALLEDLKNSTGFEVPMEGRHYPKGSKIIQNDDGKEADVIDVEA